VSRGGAAFVRRLLWQLGREGIAHVRVGDGVLGVPPATITGARLTPIVTHLLEHAPADSDDALLARLDARRRAGVRRAEREGVVTDEIRTEAQLAQYCALATETERRARARDVGAVMPRAYFATIFREMVPRRQAVMFLAQRDGEPLAGAIFLTSEDRMTYFHAASTRDPAARAFQGPTAVIWHALRFARKLGVPHFDLGAVTPTDDPAHPNHSVYHFKREFGGTVTAIRHGEIAVAPLKYAFQERVMLPVWKRAHGVYLGAVGRRSVA
jgi:lipid II:glycine glycyltransferase (peptidoglycan interpeptide bridge formation enzyme)